jgi:hypothetical protein
VIPNYLRKDEINMSKMVFIYGPQAVGKMTVGRELAKITGLKLFHNHMSIDFLLNVFEYGTPSFSRALASIRNIVFEEFISGGHEGVIFTLLRSFNEGSDCGDYIEFLKKMFIENGGEFYLVELESSLEERVRRNKTELRLKEKPTKRNLGFSERDLVNTYKFHRLNSYDGEIAEENFIKINNENIPPDEVAKIIKKKFSL